MGENNTLSMGVTKSEALVLRTLSVSMEANKQTLIPSFLFLLNKYS